MRKFNQWLSIGLYYRFASQGVAQGIELEKLVREKFFRELIKAELEVIPQPETLEYQEYYSFILGEKSSYHLEVKNDFFKNQFLALRLGMFEQRKTVVFVFFDAERAYSPHHLKDLEKTAQQLFDSIAIEVRFVPRPMLNLEPTMPKKVLNEVFDRFLWDQIFPLLKIEQKDQLIREDVDYVKFECWFDYEQ